jgi:rhamnulokinase
MTGEAFLAFDLGAESGRLFLGRLESGQLSLEEVHRFSNGPVTINGHLYWDVLRLWSEILAGLRLSGTRFGPGLSSLGLDTWGVDFGLLDANDNLIANPYHYRDSLTDGILEYGFQILPPAEVYHRTGNQFIKFNSLFQLLALKRCAHPALETARVFLNIPDLFNFWLTGVKASEFTIATTTQCFNLLERRWALELVTEMGLPSGIFQPVVQPGSIYGELRSAVRDDTGIAELPVAAVGSHDTASAVAAIPAEVERYAFISSGTWSLVGSELPEPVINDLSFGFNFTNEGGVGGKYRFLKNISALWLVQECRRSWAAQGRDYSYDELTALARQAPAFQALVNPSALVFMRPGGMPERIRKYARERGQIEPGTPGEFVRCALESLALAYRQVVEQLEKVLGYQLEAIHIVGGGSRNRLLNQFTADAVGLPVVAGPVEATAIGNILVQALALGRLDSLGQARLLVRNSFPLECFEPGDRGPWEEAYVRFLTLASPNSIGRLPSGQIGSTGTI